MTDSFHSANAETRSVQAHATQYRNLTPIEKDLLAALVEIADPCVLRTSEAFRMIANAAIAKVKGLEA